MKRLITTACALALLAAACGDDDESGDATTAPAATVESSAPAAPTPGTAGDESADPTSDTTGDAGAGTGDTAAEPSTSGTATDDSDVTDSTAGDVDDTFPEVSLVPGPSIPGLTSTQSQVVNMITQLAEAQGVEVDAECFIDVVAQLTEEDAQRIVDSSVEETSVSLSPEGEALGEQAEACVIEPEGGEGGGAEDGGTTSTP